MKKYILLVAAALSVMTMATSCKSSDLTTEGSGNAGKVKLALKSDDILNITVGSKAEDNVDINAFKVTIYDNYGEVKQAWERYDLVPEIFALEAGTYSIEVSYGNMLAAAWDSPSYYSKQDFNVIYGKLNSIEVKCARQNMQVNVDYTDNFLRHFKEVKTTVVILDSGEVPQGEKDHLVFDKDETRVGYYKPVALMVLIEGIKLDESTITHEETITDVSASYNLIIRPNIDATGNGNLTIGIDDSTQDIDHEINIPTDEEDLGLGGDTEEPDPGENPDPDPDPTTPELPTIEGFDGFNIDEELTLTDANFDFDGDLKIECDTKVAVNVTAKEGGIQSLSVKIYLDSPGLQEMVNGMFDGDNFDFADMTPEVRDIVENFLKLVEPGVDVVGEEEFSFDISIFMTLLPYGDNHFTVTVTDGEGNVETKVIRVKVIH